MAGDDHRVACEWHRSAPIFILRFDIPVGCWNVDYSHRVLNGIAGSVGLAVQALIFGAVYLAFAPSRGRSIAVLYAALAAVDGYSLVLLGAMTLGVPWQVDNVVLAVLAVGVFASPRMRRAIGRPLPSAGGLLRRQWGAAVLVVGVIAFHVLVAALVPELSIDGQLYHGPTLAQLVQTGTVWGWRMPNQYLAYSDLAMVGSINLATFTGGTWFDNGAQVPHLVILILVVNVALRGRFRRAWVRVSVALLIVSAPVIWIQPRILYVDVAYGAAVAALIVLVATNRRASGADVLFAAIAGASILAIKPTGVLTSALLLFVLLIVSLLRRRSAGQSWGRSVGTTAAAIATPSVLALGFYARNLIEFGNPVYPVQVAFGPIHLPGVIDLSVFVSGDRGSGLIDPLRWLTYAGSILEGVRSGVLKPDYDPRSGGFGWMPLLVVVVTVVAVAISSIVCAHRRGRAGFRLRGNLAAQGRLIGLAAAVLLVQPSTFDTRYVIGPTVAIVAAVAMTTVVRATVRMAEVVAGALALVLAGGQAAWVELNVYPGLAAIRELRTLPQEWQPVTPGNPWGRGENIAWLPDDPTTCNRVVLQTEGGVGTAGMMERTALSTLTYGLYGASLCNVVTSVQLDSVAAGTASEDPVPTADYVVVYTTDLQRWEALEPTAARCWHPVQSIEGTDAYPEGVTVLHASCE